MVASVTYILPAAAENVFFVGICSESSSSAVDMIRSGFFFFSHVQSGL